MTDPKDEFSIVPLENDDELFESPVGDVTSVSTWAPDAIDKSVMIMDQTEAIGDVLKARGQEMVKAGQVRINAVKNFKDALKAQLRQDGSTELVGNDWRLCVQKTKAKLVLDDEAKIPEQYLKTRTVVEIDQEALRADLEAGIAVEGAHLEMSGALRIRPNTKKVSAA